ncbi:MAG: ABC transporter ATP-binding protein [Candidatus Micrarchaeota archaeon]
MITVENIRKVFGDFEAVSNVSFEVKDHEIFGIAGPNGAGKSTIVKMLATILKPTSGKASILGMDIYEKPEDIRKIIGYLPEEPRMYDYMSGTEYLELFSELYSTHYDIRELVRFMGLQKHAERKIGEYSKGLRQRLSVARALVNDPRLLILDEPTMGLDPASARDLREKVLEMRDEGRTIIMCTHYMEEADFLCDRLAILDSGAIAAQGSPEELKNEIGKSLALDVVFDTESEKLLSSLKAKKRGRGMIVPVKSIQDGMQRVTTQAKKSGAKILSIKTISPTLEDVFVKVTRKAEQ